MDSASRTCFCSVECAWTLRFRQQTAAAMAARAAAAQRVTAAQAAAAAPQPAAPRGDHYRHHGRAAYGAAAGGGARDRSVDRGVGGNGRDDARGAAYVDPLPDARREDEEEGKEDARGAALQQSANLLRNGGLGNHVRCDDRVPVGGAVDSESDSSSPSWDGDDSRHHAMFDWQALDKDKPFGTFGRMR